MDFSKLTRRSEFSWMIEPTGQMRVPVIIYGSEMLVSAMDQKVSEQASNVAALPGIQQSAFAMPDAHWGDGFSVGVHCGSRGLGHQIGTDFLREMEAQAPRFGLKFGDRELASAPIHSEIGQRYLGAMRAGINCALANRQIIAHLAREVRNAGQPVIVGGSMGTCSFVLAGVKQQEEQAFSSAIHGAGRAMSRHQAARTWQGRQVVDELANRGILIRCESMRSIAEEVPNAYKDVTAVVEAAVQAQLARLVARVEPMVCVKG